MIVETDIDVLTGPMWMFEMFSNFKHPSKKAMLNPVIDPDGDPIIDVAVLDDVDWDFIGGNDITSPEGESKPVREWLTTKKFKFEEKEL